jgi:hypothetical protein
MNSTEPLSQVFHPQCGRKSRVYATRAEAQAYEEGHSQRSADDPKDYVKGSPEYKAYFDGFYDRGAWQ